MNPLLHFLLGGAAYFAAAYWFGWKGFVVAFLLSLYLRHDPDLLNDLKHPDVPRL
jgi:hypothetical protein